MPLPYEIAIGWRYTRAARSAQRNGFISFISGVSMLGIALGVAALIIVLSVMNGFQKEVRDKMLSVVSHIEITAPHGQAMLDVQKAMDEAQAHPKVQAAAPFVSAQVLLARAQDMKGALLRGIDPAREAQVTALAESNAKALAALREGTFGIVLGAELAQQLGAGVGDVVTVMAPGGQITPAGIIPRMKQMSVVGTLDTGHYEYDATLALMHHADAQRLLRLAAPTGIRLKIDNLHEAPTVTRELANMLTEYLFLRDWTQQNRTWFAAVQLEKRMMFIILTLIVAVAAFNLVSTLVMTVTDKRADIAILRTLGASPASIMGIFMVQGAAVGVIGTASGVALGLAVALNIDTLVPALEQLLGATFLPRDVYLISRMPSDPQSADIVPIAIISLVLAFIATLYPSWRASRINPAEALRYE